MRRYDEEIAVRTAVSGDPQEFVWRGRLFRVAGVEQHWVARRPWWRTAFEEPSVGVASGALVVEESRWRVQAQAGRHGRAGVYDLARASREQWRLVGVAD